MEGKGRGNDNGVDTMCLRSMSGLRCNVSLPPLFQLTREGTAPGIHSNHCRSNTPKSSTNSNQDVKTERNGFRIKWGTGSILRILPPKETITT